LSTTCVKTLLRLARTAQFLSASARSLSLSLSLSVSLLFPFPFLPLEWREALANWASTRLPFRLSFVRTSLPGTACEWFREIRDDK
jgi:hypothetical protein